TGDLTLTFFSARKDYLEKILPVGETRIVSGAAQFYDGMLQMVHPDRIVSEAEADKLPQIEPIYPLTEGLGINVVRKAVAAALDKRPDLPEWQDPSWLTQQKWSSFATALRCVHHPAEPALAFPDSPAWSRLAYDELLAGQLALAMVRANQKRLAGRPSRGD